MSNRPVVIDLFSGCGGMSLGLEAAGFDIAASVEIDPIHSLVHHYNFPYEATICKDISQLSGKEILNKIESKGFTIDIDVLSGGPSCQGFSNIGTRNLNDPRNQLIFEYARIVSEIKPKYFIFENVPGMATGKYRKFLNELIAIFKKHNYSVIKPIQILDASLYGAPQKRKRLILIGYRNDVPKPNYPLPTHGLDLQPFITTEQAISDLNDIPVFIGKDCGIKTSKVDSLRRKKYLYKEYSLCHKRASKNVIWGHLGSQHTDKTIARFTETIPGKKEPISRFFKLSPDGLCNTLRAGTDRSRGAFTAPRPIHYQQPRCITIREAARLHTFPDWFQFHRTIHHGARQIGNAVIPLLAKSLGAEIIKHLDVDISSLKIRKLQPSDTSLLSYKMNQAANFWQVDTEIIPKRSKINQ